MTAIDPSLYLPNAGGIGGLYGLQQGQTQQQQPAIPWLNTLLAQPPGQGQGGQPTSPGVNLLQSILQNKGGGQGGGGGGGYPGLSPQTGPAMIGKGTMQLLKMLAGI